MISTKRLTFLDCSGEGHCRQQREGQQHFGLLVVLELAQEKLWQISALHIMVAGKSSFNVVESELERVETS